MLVALAAVLVSVTPLPSKAVRGMIGEARRIVARTSLWPGFSHTRLRVQVVEPTRELLFCGAPAPGFTPLAFDPVTGCSLQARPRVLALDIAGTADLDGRPTIQIGLPAVLEMSRAQWLVTVLHESFHQYQYRLPGYQQAVERVRRSLGQIDANWPLNYAFPYADPKVDAAFGRMNAAALAFLGARSPAQARRAIAAYVAVRDAACAVVGAKDWSYYEFQVGQEGVARWTELRLGEAAGRDDPEVAAVAKDRRLGLVTSLQAIDEQGLKAWKRNSFYVLGAIEAEMLERIKPDWRAAYRHAPFAFAEQLHAAEVAF